MDKKHEINSYIEFFKSFEKIKYPIAIHQLSLDLEVDYIIGLGKQFQKRTKKLTCELYDMSSNTKNKINEYLSNNSNNDNGKDMLIFYLMMKTAIQILLRYYNEDGTMK